jgi:hypothetical protein
VRRLLVVIAALALAGAGCGSDGAGESPPGGPSAPTTSPPTATAPEPERRTPAAPTPLEPARCTPAMGPTCVAHTGRVLAIESVDSDGDGDLHVIAAGGSVTAPGITVFDVSKVLRPAEDPRPGDRVTGAGPVFRGSFRQRQVEVRTFRVAAP